MVFSSSASASRAIPTVAELPLLGSLFAHTRDRLAFYQRVIHEYGNVCRFHVGPLQFLLFNVPDSIQSILTEHDKDFSKGELLRKTISPFSGNGLFLSEGEFHRKQRKLIAPKFQPKTIQTYADVMVGYGERIVEPWQTGSVVDINRQMTALTLSIVGNVLFNIETFDETDSLSQALTTNIEHAAYVMSSPFAIPLSWPTPRNRRVQASMRVISDRLQRMIDERKAAPSDEERHDVLSLLLHARDEDGNAMSEKQLMDECQTVFGAGHETTATALTWTWYLLAKYPAVYKKLQAEVDMVLQGRTPTVADLARLPYALQIFKEALRLYPPAYIILREALHDVDIEGYSVPKGAMVMIPVYVLQRDPQIFPEPDVFDPDRFLPEREKLLPRNAFIPFGTGPRICIGNHFSLMEGQLLIATLAQRVSFELLNEHEVVPDLNKSVTLRPGAQIMLKVTKRS